VLFWSHALLILALVALQSTQDVVPADLFAPASEGSVVEEAIVAPIFHLPFTCSQHASGQLDATGDALGSDCSIEGGVSESGAGFMRPFRGDGSRNEDWYGWHANVLAPIAGIVTFVRTNPLTNEPGTMGRDPASLIVIRAADGTTIVLAHTDDPRVKVGDKVDKGQVIGLVGNNGFSRAPHVHIGAYRGSRPLQVRWDLRAMAEKPAPK
jgi:murein DD-endopeptidase MepM/ murein hydrolase activator NlpD